MAPEWVVTESTVVLEVPMAKGAISELEMDTLMVTTAAG